jgi:hypothetical protein
MSKDLDVKLNMDDDREYQPFTPEQEARRRQNLLRLTMLTAEEQQELSQQLERLYRGGLSKAVSARERLALNKSVIERLERQIDVVKRFPSAAEERKFLEGMLQSAHWQKREAWSEDSPILSLCIHFALTLGVSLAALLCLASLF